MIKYSLRTRMMILILAPTLILGILLSTFFMISRYHEFEKQVINTGSSIIEPLAIASEHGMIVRNRDSIRQLINLLHRQNNPIIRAITVFDKDNKFFATSNYNYNSAQLRLAKNHPIPHSLMLTHRENSLVLRMPIISEFYLSSDYLQSNDGIAPQTLGYIAIDLDLKTVHLKRLKELLISILLLLFCLCIAVLLTYRLIQDVTVPIHNMVNAVDRIRRGRLNSRVEGNTFGELDTLKNGINAMAMSLAAYRKKMQQSIDQATFDLRNTLEQIEKQNVELELAKKRAQEAARIKSDFLANISHELRTPLNAVIGFTRQTLKTALTPTQVDYMQTIERSGNHLLSIINDVLDFSKLEVGKLALEQIPFLLRATLDEVIILLAHTAHEKGLELILHVNQDVPEQVVGDAMRLQQIITNLLGNAIKFTEKGSIDININLLCETCQTKDEIKLAVEIRDTGIGISETQYPQLFQAFGQADASTSRRHGGTGLGLAITEHLVKKMKGTIGFSSQLNHGSTFVFNIALTLNENTLDQAASMEPLVNKHLAYIENNATAAQATLHFLNGTPLQITHCSTLKQLPQQHYDFLLIGIAVPSALNQTDHRQQLITALEMADQVILVLPSQLQVEAEQLKQAGAKACLLRPISSNRLFPLLLAKNALDPLIPQKKPDPVARFPLRVMAVDDNPANLKLIGTLLAEQVEETIVCESGVKALSMARRKRLDIILMDIQMPQMDGIQTSQLIHQIPHHQNTPIIAVTAHAVSGQRDYFLSMGMADYLAKPIDEALLRCTLSRYSRLKNHLPNPRVADHPVFSPPSRSCDTTLDVTTWAAKSLDWPLAIQQAANKEDLAYELLSMLLGSLPLITKQIQDMMNKKQNDENTHAAILSLIHKLHGSCGYTGTPRLQQICLTIESQLRQKIALQQLQPEWLELLDEIENVTQAAQQKIDGLQKRC
ncbi:Signal transduction histidine kinase [Candidatus Regiella insecticola 5.15]|uniref:histidine kinase n=1 Tax=Candidatus Regiella insecticola 5.15 TaxID=1005043 RepID=G2H034_9ENTR|nr:two-component sensor histidine kinase BarA [Candidatus Regiella insecticola]EGY28658.1 Signal transduction histidine kinase [Candidatus Regiella insecticola 5.15]